MGYHINLETTERDKGHEEYSHRGIRARPPRVQFSKMETSAPVCVLGRCGRSRTSYLDTTGRCYELRGHNSRTLALLSPTENVNLGGFVFRLESQVRLVPACPNAVSGIRHTSQDAFLKSICSRAAGHLWKLSLCFSTVSFAKLAACGSVAPEHGPLQDRMPESARTPGTHLLSQIQRTKVFALGGFHGLQHLPMACVSAKTAGRGREASTLSSIGKPWQSQPGTYLTAFPCSI